MTTLAIPTIHMNGTSASTLIKELMAAKNATDVAIELLRAACPNGRDFYTQGPNAIQTALTQHSNRLHNLEAVSTELYEIACAIDDKARASRHDSAA